VFIPPRSVALAVRSVTGSVVRQNEMSIVISVSFWLLFFCFGFQFGLIIVCCRFFFFLHETLDFVSDFGVENDKFGSFLLICPLFFCGTEANDHSRRPLAAIAQDRH